MCTETFETNENAADDENETKGFRLKQNGVQIAI